MQSLPPPCTLRQSLFSKPLLLVSQPVTAQPSTTPHLCSSVISPPAHLPRDIHALTDMLHTIDMLAEQADVDLAEACPCLRT